MPRVDVHPSYRVFIVAYLALTCDFIVQTGCVLRRQGTLLPGGDNMQHRSNEMHFHIYQKRAANVGKVPCQAESRLGEPER